MSSVQLRLMCLLLPDDNPDDHVITVDINTDKTIASLKNKIKDRYPRTLADVDVYSLVLWKCSFPAEKSLQEVLKTIHFDANDTRLHRLDPRSRIFEYFGTTGLHTKTVHILIEVPDHGEMMSVSPFQC